jgi:hypothetical protein
MLKKLINRLAYYLLNPLKQFNVLAQDIAQIYFSRKKIPAALFIELTNRCNANCIFCAYQYDTSTKVELDTALCNKALLEYKNIGGEAVDFTPLVGEVLLSKNFFECVEFAHSLGFKSISTYTNLLRAHKIDMKRLLCSGLTQLHVSTAPLEEDIYKKIYRNKNYRQFLLNIENLLITFNALTQKQRSVQEIFIEFRADRSYQECIVSDDFKRCIEPHLSPQIIIGAFNRYDNWGGIIQETDLLEGMQILHTKQNKRLPCSRLSNIQVNADGQIRSCGCRFNPLKDEDPFVLGNIK